MTEEDASHVNQYISYAKDISFVAGAQVVVSLLQFIRLPILTKSLGISLYGTWSLIWVTVSLVVPLVTLGLGMAMVRFLAVEKDTAKIREGYYSVLFTVLAAGTFISLILTLCSNLFAASILGDINHSQLVMLTSFMILSEALCQVSVLYFRTFRWMRLYSALLVGKAVVSVGLMISFLLLGWELQGIIIAILSSGVLSTTLALSVALKHAGFQFPRFTALRSYLKYGLPLIPTSALLWIMHSSNRYLIGYLMDIRDVGIYAAAYSLAHIVSLLLNPLQVVLLPTISKTYDEGDIPQTRIYLKYSLKYLMMLSIPAAFGLTILASPLLRILTTSEFISGSIVVPLLAFGLVIYNFHRICIYILYLVKQTHWVVRLLVMAAILNICLNLLLIPYFGILGAAMASLIAYVVLGILTLFVSFRYLKFDLGFPFIAKSILASAIMAIIIWLLDPLGITMVAASMILGLIIYLTLILIFKGFSRNELIFVKSLASRFGIKGVRR
jgi:O-antigen/teichoic acid export membrane protein